MGYADSQCFQRLYRSFNISRIILFPCIFGKNSVCILLIQQKYGYMDRLYRIGSSALRTNSPKLNGLYRADKRLSAAVPPWQMRRYLSAFFRQSPTSFVIFLLWWATAPVILIHTLRPIIITLLVFRLFPSVLQIVFHASCLHKLEHVSSTSAHPSDVTIRFPIQKVLHTSFFYMQKSTKDSLTFVCHSRNSSSKMCRAKFSGFCHNFKCTLSSSNSIS